MTIRYTLKNMHITIVGAGNVATHMSVALKLAGHVIDAVWSRTEASAQKLAELLECNYSTFSTQMLYTETPHSDCYIISVKDDALENVARQLIPVAPQALWLHTAGSMPMQLLNDCGALHYGVLYPMQTFSKSKSVNFSEVPLFVESNDSIEDTQSIALSLSKKVYELDSEGRKHLHLAAVYACNFVNHCYALSAKVLDGVGVPFDVMLPLIEETAEKVHEISPGEAQTGPAIRGDKLVMQGHLNLLKDSQMKEIYQIMSQSIANNRND